MQVHVLMELTPGPQLPRAVVPMVTYGGLHRGSSRVPICLDNLSTCSMEILTKTVVGQVALTNQVPLVVLLTRTSEKFNDKPKRDDLGGPGHSRPQGVVQTGTEAGQRISAQMGTPVCVQQAGPGQNCYDQA